MPRGTKGRRDLWHYLPARDAQLKTDIIMDGCDTAARTVSKLSKYIQ